MQAIQAVPEQNKHREHDSDAEYSAASHSHHHYHHEIHAERKVERRERRAAGSRHNPKHNPSYTAQKFRRESGDQGHFFTLGPILASRTSCKGTFVTYGRDSTFEDGFMNYDTGIIMGAGASSSSLGNNSETDPLRDEHSKRYHMLTLGRISSHYGTIAAGNECQPLITNPLKTKQVRYN